MNPATRIAALVIVPVLALSGGCSEQPSNNSKASTAQTDKASAASERTDGPKGNPRPKGQSVEALIAKLQDADEEASASDVLIGVGAPAIPPLIELLKTTPSRYVRLAAARILSEFDDPGADAALGDALKTPNDEMTAAAYRFLLRKGQPATEPALIDALNTFGKLDMAEDFVASANPVLKTAAERWASKNGRFLGLRSSSREVVRWGGNASTATRLLLFHFDDSLDSSSGVKPSESKGVSFVAGKWGSAVFIGAGGILKYPFAGNLDFNDGTIEMWISPRLDGNDPVYKQRNHSLLMYLSRTLSQFLVSEGTFGGFYAGSVRGGDYKGTGGGDISEWKAGEWHHIAFTYSSLPLRQRVYIDGGLISEATSSMPAPALDGSGFMIGGFDSEFAVDELQISKGEKTKSEIGRSAFRQSPFPDR